jgi:D-tyrosyl-tRNA(Tyr) deacylase
MRIVAQRVSRAAVRVDEETVGSIGPGLLVLVAFSAADGDAELEWMARKLTGIRVFPDGEGKMNRSVREAGGSLLVVSQFTLYGDTSRGMRPSFTGAAAPERAQGLYELFLDVLRAEGVPVESGRFAAMMDVELVNEGPVTLILDR